MLAPEETMRTLRNLLESGDPLRLEPAPADEARARIRASVIGAVEHHMPARRRRVPSIAVAVAAIAVAAVVTYALWSRAVPPLQAAVRFEVHLAEEQPAPGLMVAGAKADGRLIYLHPEVVVDNADVTRASVVQQADGRFAVAVDFAPAAVRRLSEATAAHVGRPLAIVLDGDVALAPTVRGPIGPSAMITGDYSQAEAERIANGIAPP
jgi:preprotein translocase subunit SecD